MKVLLVYPDINTIQFPHFQHGVASVSAVLKQGGHDTALIYLNRELIDEKFIEQTRRHNPDIVAFSSTTLQFSFVRRYARAVKAGLGLPVVIGGIHATIAPEEVMKDENFDFLVQAEGEYSMLELADALETGKDISEIPNLWLRKKNGELVKNPLRPAADLEELPFVDRGLFDNEVLMRENDHQVAIMASRGCPYSCTYCCNTVLSELAGGTKNWVRQRRVSSVIAEVEYLQKRFPDMKSMIFMDEIFTLDKKWVQEYCERYKSRFSTPFQIFLRVETVDQETLAMLREAGLYSIIVGVESGNDRIRREVLNRRMSNEQIVRVFEWADELGIETWDFNMIGLPGETEDNIRETMELNRRIKPHHVQVSIFYPFPGTPIHERCKKEGLLPVEETTSVFHNKPTLELPGLPRERIHHLFAQFRALAHLLEAKKSAKGYYDLTAHFDQARIKEGGKDFVALWLIRISGEDRMSILLHPDSSGTWRLRVRPDSVLRFGIAFSPDVWDRPGAGCTYRIKIKPRMRRGEVVYSRYFDPKHNPDERRWVDDEVDLSRFGGRTVEMTLSTSTPPGENQYCVAFWSRPYLVEKGDSA
jgi:anaerobic magnesium-protoporphyrin IX monomethyl ester cyclase